MIVDLIIGIIASLIASFLTGFFGNKMFAKNSSMTIKVYILFLSIYVFFLTGLFSVMFNINEIAAILKLSEVNIFKFYSNTINTMLFSLLPVALITGAIILSEIMHRSEKRDHKQFMDCWSEKK